jgi:hypothetical protein
VISAAGPSRAVLTGVLVGVIALAALAGTAYPDAATTAAPVPVRPPKRAIPDYDGRPDRGVTAADVALFVPRLVLFPFRLVIDYGIRRPLGAAVRAAEHSKGLRRGIQYLFLGPKTRTPQFFPVALYDFGFAPSLGARMLWGDGYATPGSKLYLKLGIGGWHMWRADAGTRLMFGRTALTIDAGARERPDQVFNGLGPDTTDEAGARYRHTRTSGRVSVGHSFDGVDGGTVQAFAQGLVAHHAFRASRFHGAATIEDQVAAGLIAELPADYPDGYNAATAGLTIGLDSRGRRNRRKASGARIDAIVEHGWDLDDPDRTWVRIDATAGGAFLLDPVRQRKLDLKFRYQQVIATGDGDIPFTELVTTGGLRGFASGRLRGETAAQLTADYIWPIAAWLDAHGHLGVGNVFGENLSGFDAGSLRGSAGIGISIAGLSEERQVRVATAVGTDPFSTGFHVTSFRLVAGFATDY